jgi:hypothetical protein
LFAPARPAEELYDMQSDPHETRNLAADPKYKKTLEQMRARLSGWIKETGDRGQQPETAAMYDSDMAVYLEDRGRQGDGRLRTLKETIALMKKWAAEGK